MHEMPQVITHNYHPERGALQNVCCLPREEAKALLSDIRVAGLARLRHDYLERRLETERWLLRECTRKLGTPRLTHPLYFFLGDFADGLDPARPASLIVPLAAMPPETLTFTYLDSMASLRDSGPWHGKVFSLWEIKDVVANEGLPQACCDREALPKPFIEVQVWDDRPIQQYLAKREAS